MHVKFPILSDVKYWYNLLPSFGPACSYLIVLLFTPIVEYNTPKLSNGKNLSRKKALNNVIMHFCIVKSLEFSNYYA